SVVCLLYVSAFDVSPLTVFFHRPGALRHLHSFPTRRSSDLLEPYQHVVGELLVVDRHGGGDEQCGHHEEHEPQNLEPEPAQHRRSEEHTSELQSRENLVCRLLLEKKKNPNS